MSSSAYDQLSTIIHRLEQLAELADPVSLVTAIGQAISEVIDPLPGNVDDLRSLAAAFSRAARDISPAGTELSDMARAKLPGTWQGDAQVSASQVVSDTSQLVAQLPPAFTYAASSIDAYANTLSQLEKRRRDLVQQLHQAAHDGPDVSIFGIQVPLLPTAWSGWITAVRNLIYGAIELYNDLQNAADTLAGEFADVQSQASVGIALNSGMPLTDAVVLASAQVNGSPLLSPAQLTKLAGMLKTMSPADRDRLDAALRGSGSQLAQAYVLKALAAGHSLRQVATFAAEIRGQPDSWLTDHLSLASIPGELSYGGQPLVQMNQTECGTTSIVAARVLADPLFAYSLTTGAGGNALSPQQFAARVTQVEQQTHDQTNTTWPQWAGTSPWGVASGMNSGPAGNAGYGVHWVDDTDPRSASPALQQAISATDAGHPVVVLLAPTIGAMAGGTPLHYVLITGHSGSVLNVYDPETGSITQVPDSDFRNGTMTSIDPGAPHVNAVIMPGS